MQVTCVRIVKQNRIPATSNALSRRHAPRGRHASHAVLAPRGQSRGEHRASLGADPRARPSEATCGSASTKRWATRTTRRSSRTGTTSTLAPSISSSSAPAGTSCAFSSGAVSSPWSPPRAMARSPCSPTTPWASKTLAFKRPWSDGTSAVALEHVASLPAWLPSCRHPNATPTSRPAGRGTSLGPRCSAEPSPSTSSAPSAEVPRHRQRRGGVDYAACSPRPFATPSLAIGLTSPAAEWPRIRDVP
jgi:hypothetical protein